MKKIIFTLLILAGVTLGVNAQENSKFWVGGSLGLQSLKMGDEKKTTFTLAPEVGYNFSDRWAAGLLLGISHVDDSNDYSGQDNSLTTFTINPFARYSYFKKGIVSLFVDGGVAYARNNDDGSEVEVGFRPGIAVKVAPNIQFLGKVGFLGYYWSDDYYETEYFAFNLNLNQIQLGVRLLF